MIDFTKPVQTRDGRKVRILCTDSDHPHYPVVGLVENISSGTWTLDGKYQIAPVDTGVDEVDLINVPEELSGYVCVYRSVNYPKQITFSNLRTDPDRPLTPNENLIAIIPVSFKVGQGL